MARKLDYSTTFEEAWGIYPKRFPDNPKRPAYGAWIARVNEGVAIADLLTATRNYADYCRRVGKEGTETVLMAQTFFGPNERWRAYLETKTAVAAPKRDLGANPKRWVRTEEQTREGLVSIRGIIEGLAKAKALPNG